MATFVCFILFIATPFPALLRRVLILRSRRVRVGNGIRNLVERQESYLVLLRVQ